MVFVYFFLRELSCFYFEICQSRDFMFYFFLLSPIPHQLVAYILSVFFSRWNRKTSCWWLCFWKICGILGFFYNNSAWCTTWSFSPCVSKCAHDLLHLCLFEWFFFFFFLFISCLRLFGMHVDFTVIHQTIFASTLPSDDIDVLHFATVHVCIFDSCYSFVFFSWFVCF